MEERQQTVFLDERKRPCVATRFRVRYYETDRMGVVHHAAYVTWFEEGRSEFTRAMGYSYAQMEADGIGLMVSEISARYVAPARYDEEVVVVTCLESLRSRELIFAYEVRRGSDGELLVTGTTRLLAIDSQGRIRTLPSELSIRTRALMQ